MACRIFLDQGSNPRPELAADFLTTARELLHLFLDGTYEEEKSECSSDLWLGIKERHCLYNIKLPGEAASADIEGTTNDPEC